MIGYHRLDPSYIDTVNWHVNWVEDWGDMV